MSGCYDYAYSNVEDFAYSMLHSNCTIRQICLPPEDIKAIQEVLKYIKDDNSLSSGSGD